MTNTLPGSEAAGRRLAEWMHSTGLTLSSLAAVLRCTPSHVSHLRRGRRRPGLGMALALERITAEWVHGPILAREWHVTAVDTDTTSDAPQRAA